MSSDSATNPDHSPVQRYLRPGRFNRMVFNPLVAAATRLGVPLAGSRVLQTTGRVSGQARTTPVNLLSLHGERYLVAPRGCTDWVRNVRADNSVELIVGRRREAAQLVEIDGEEAAPVLRSYLKRWGWEVGAFIGELDADDDDAVLAALEGIPVFAVNDA